MPRRLCVSLAFYLIRYKIKLGHALKQIPKAIERQDYTKPMWSALDWLIDRDIHHVEIDPKYADDISFLRSEESKINQVERIIPAMLEESGLYVNKTKTEKYHISRQSPDESWRKCKYLGSLLDTNEDIKRREGRAIDSYKTLSRIFESRYISEEVKIRVFKTYVQSIFMYNSELWTMTKELENRVGIIQRKFLRRITKVVWPRKISNVLLYERTNTMPWSVIILKRRMSWFGHLMRLPTLTPARSALNHFINPVKRPPGRPKTTWLATVMKEIRNLSNIPLQNDVPSNIKYLEVQCSDRKNWNKLVGSMISTKLKLCNEEEKRRSLR